MITEPFGPDRNEFLSKVQKAAAKPPWNMHNPNIVCKCYTPERKKSYHFPGIRWSSLVQMPPIFAVVLPLLSRSTQVSM